MRDLSSGEHRDLLKVTQETRDKVIRTGVPDIPLPSL